MYNSMRQNLIKHDQEHLIKFWDTLTNEQQCYLQSDIDKIDFETIKSNFDKAMSSTAKYSNHELTPPSKKIIGGHTVSSADELKEFNETGLKAISECQVAVLLLAGGQGTRLGVTYPKGMYNVDLPSKKTLYNLQADRIKKIQQIAARQNGVDSCIVPWYIMTSEFTEELTREYFSKNKYFGLDRNQILFFEQKMIPCLDKNGKIILENKHKIAKAPDGNGGLYEVLLSEGILDDMDRRGVRYVHIYCVDNILVKVADPQFIGYCIEKHADCAAKVVEKTDPRESVGVICCVGEGRYGVIEYSEIDSDLASLRDGDGRLVYRCGGIANHFATTAFLKYIAQEKADKLPYHVAHKKIEYVNEEGKQVKPTTPNGVKLEKFFFDIFPYSKSFFLWFVDREEEFSPLKNSDSAPSESPTTCRNSIFKLHSKWIKKAGGVINGSDELICEVCPSVSYMGENLEELVHNKTFNSPVILN